MGWFQRLTICFVLCAFILTSVAPAQTLPIVAPSSVSPLVSSPLLRGLTIHPDQPLSIDFVIDQGEHSLAADDLQKSSMTFVKYFLAALAVPEKDVWVNLSPNEPDRIVQKNLGSTQLGQDLLNQDYLLKQLTASLLSPENDTGKKFWEMVYEKLYASSILHLASGKDELPNANDQMLNAIESFNRVWIVPASAKIYQKGNSVFVTDAEMDVMLEGDYLASGIWHSVSGEEQKPNANEQMLDAKQIIKETILPIIKDEINHGETFVQLRQIYHALILAGWYKNTLKQSLLSRSFADKGQTQGISSDDPQAIEKIYQKYLDAFKSGLEGMIKEDYDPQTQSVTARKYITGGYDNANLSKAVVSDNDLAELDGHLPAVMEVDLAEMSHATDQAMMDGKSSFDLTPYNAIRKLQRAGKDAATRFAKAVRSIRTVKETLESHPYDLLNQAEDELSIMGYKAYIIVLISTFGVSLKKAALKALNRTNGIEVDMFFNMRFLKQMERFVAQGDFNPNQLRILRHHLPALGRNLTDAVLKQVIFFAKRIDFLYYNVFERNANQYASVFLTQEEYDDLPSNLKNKDGRLETPRITESVQNEILSYHPRESARRKTYLTFFNRANNPVEGVDQNNLQALQKINMLRQQYVEHIAGQEFQSYAEWAIRDDVINRPNLVRDMLTGPLFKKAQEVFDKEETIFKEYKKRDLFAEDKDNIYPWDVMYYYQQFMKERAGIIDARYPARDFVVKTAQAWCKVLNMEVREASGDLSPGLSADVLHFDVLENGQKIGELYFDLYARAGKQVGGGGFAVEIRQIRINEKGEVIRSGIAAVAGNARLDSQLGFVLTQYEREILAHEMGHMFHMLKARSIGMLESRSHLPISLIEAQSAFIEFAMSEIDILRNVLGDPNFSHPLMEQTIKGQPMGFHMLQQIQLALLDIELVDKKNLSEEQMKKIYHEMMVEPSNIPADQVVFRSTFKHLGNPRYAGRYWGYLYGYMLAVHYLKIYRAGGDISELFKMDFSLSPQEIVKDIPLDLLIREFIEYLDDKSKVYDAAMMDGSIGTNRLERDLDRKLTSQELRVFRELSFDQNAQMWVLTEHSMNNLAWDDQSEDLRSHVISIMRGLGFDDVGLISYSEERKRPSYGGEEWVTETHKDQYFVYQNFEQGSPPSRLYTNDWIEYAFKGIEGREDDHALNEKKLIQEFVLRAIFTQYQDSAEETVFEDLIDQMQWLNVDKEDLKTNQNLIFALKHFVSPLFLTVEERGNSLVIKTQWKKFENAEINRELFNKWLEELRKYENSHIRAGRPFSAPRPIEVQEDRQMITEEYLKSILTRDYLTDDEKAVFEVLRYVGNNIYYIAPSSLDSLTMQRPNLDSERVLNMVQSWGLVYRGLLPHEGILDEDESDEKIHFFQYDPSALKKNIKSVATAQKSPAAVQSAVSPMEKIETAFKAIKDEFSPDRARLIQRLVVKFVMVQGFFEDVQSFEGLIEKMPWSGDKNQFLQDKDDLIRDLLKVQAALLKIESEGNEYRILTQWKTFYDYDGTLDDFKRWFKDCWGSTENLAMLSLIPKSMIPMLAIAAMQSRIPGLRKTGGIDMAQAWSKTQLQKDGSDSNIMISSVSDGSIAPLHLSPVIRNISFPASFAAYAASLP